VGTNENSLILGKSQRVFLTGHTGFKGTWLTLLLEAYGHEVIGYSLEAKSKSLYERLGRKGKIAEFISDIRDVNSLGKCISDSKPDVVIHMAAQALVLDSYKLPFETFEINSQGTANLLKASLDCNSVKGIAAVTTDKVYRNLGTGVAFKEDDPLEGKSDPYSASKVGSEAAISAWKKISEVQGGPPIVTLRSGNVVGGGDYSSDRLIPDLIRSFEDQTPIKIRNIEGTRPWMHVLDSLNGYLLAIDLAMKEKKSNVFNFAPSDKPLSVGEVISIAKKNWPNNFMVEVEQNISQNLEATLLSLDATKAMRELQWTPHWSQETSVASTITWWRNILLDGIDPIDVCQSEIRESLLNEK